MPQTKEINKNFNVIKGALGTELKDFPLYILLQFDGGAEPNPGRGAASAVLYRSSVNKSLRAEVAVFMMHCTNNEAEYTGLLIGLQKAAELGIDKIAIEGDSMLVINQISGTWKVKDSRMQEYHRQIMTLIREKFTSVVARHVYRNNNTASDELGRECSAAGHSLYRIHGTT